MSWTTMTTTTTKRSTTKLYLLHSAQRNINESVKIAHTFFLSHIQYLNIWMYVCYINGNQSTASKCKRTWAMNRLLWWSSLRNADPMLCGSETVYAESCNHNELAFGSFDVDLKAYGTPNSTAPIFFDFTKAIHTYFVQNAYNRLDRLIESAHLIES